MPIRLRCPSCNAGLSVASRKAGQSIRCPGCGAEIDVPRLAEAALAAGAAPAATQPPSPAPRRWPDEEPGGEDEEFSIRKPQTEFEEMDLTPMVDVTFLLLIFFMITASFTIQKVMNYPPPEPEQEGVSQVMQKLEDVERDSIVIEVDENDQITVENQPVSDRSQLEGVIERFMGEQGKNTNEILLKQHYYSSHEMTVAIKDAAAAAGIQKFRSGILPGTGPRK
jgi:biopolymer transport protein ExbD